MSECFLWRPIDLDLIPQKLPFHLDFDLSGSEDGEAGTNLLSNYPKPTHQHDFDFQPVSHLNSLFVLSHSKVANLTPESWLASQTSTLNLGLSFSQSLKLLLIWPQIWANSVSHYILK